MTSDYFHMLHANAVRNNVFSSISRELVEFLRLETIISSEWLKDHAGMIFLVVGLTQNIQSMRSMRRKFFLYIRLIPKSTRISQAMLGIFLNSKLCLGLFTTVFGSQLTKVFQIDSDGFPVFGLLRFWHSLNSNFTWALLMQSFKREQRPIWQACKGKTAYLRRAEVVVLKWRGSWNHGALLCHRMIIPFFSLKVQNWGRRSHNLDGEMVWWISSFSCFWWCYHVYF